MRWAAAHAHAPIASNARFHVRQSARGFVIRAVSRCGLGGLLTFEEFTQPFDAGQPVGRRLTQLLLSPGHIFAFDFLRVEAHHEPVADGQRGGRHWKRHSKTNCDEKMWSEHSLFGFCVCFGVAMVTQGARGPLSLDMNEWRPWDLSHGENVKENLDHTMSPGPNCMIYACKYVQPAIERF